MRPVNPKLLPLPKLRRAGGGLFTEKQEAVPPVVRSALTFPLHLGSVELPLTKLDIARLEKLQVCATGRPAALQRTPFACCSPQKTRCSSAPDG